MADHSELIRNIRGRVEQCRQLANSVSDPTARQVLLDMANEGEADIRKLEQQTGG
jgi:hypothetical protein